LSFSGLDAQRLDQAFQKRDSDPGRITLVVDDGEQSCVAYVALLNIDWERGVAGDMSMRVAPSRCGQGIGTKTIHVVAEWCQENGLSTLRLNVAASNTRAVRCYEKAGFRRQEEFWRPDTSLSAASLRETRYDFLREHVRVVDGVVHIRFWWMQLG
jgi:RimJ/RimL family protein N-acetyltransferase